MVLDVPVRFHYSTLIIVEMKRHMLKVIPREEHTLSRTNIAENALKVLYRLNEGGFEAYLVGGGVRDLLLGIQPKDFDIATSASPEEVKKLFRNCRLIGRRFRLAHVHFGREIIEVATFRKGHTDEDHLSAHGMILRDNVYGTLDEDVVRRDFTVNALYYNIADHSVLDFYGGFGDLKKRTIRLIGEPVQRFREDPIRMLRGVRLAAKLNCTIAKETEQPIASLANLLHNVPHARILDELMKTYRSGHALTAFELLMKHGLFKELFPEVEMVLQESNAKKMQAMLERTMQVADERTADGRSLSPAFLFACLLWWPMQKLLKEYQAQGMKLFPALQSAMETTIHQQMQTIAIPKRFTAMMRDVWVLQYLLPRRRGKRVYRNYNHRYFRAAYDFIVLRGACGENVNDLAEWWTKFQEVDKKQQQKMIAAVDRRK